MAAVYTAIWPGLGVLLAGAEPHPHAAPEGVQQRSMVRTQCSSLADESQPQCMLEG